MSDIYRDTFGNESKYIFTNRTVRAEASTKVIIHIQVNEGSRGVLVALNILREPFRRKREKFAYWLHLRYSICLAACGNTDN